MREIDELTHAFLEAHPVDAARELERLPGGDVAALFERAPARLMAPVADAMLPHAAAAALLPLGTAQAALILAAMRAPGAAGVLRHAPEALRRRLLDELPTATALACRTLLRYPDDAIGALVDTAVVAMPAGARASEALEAVRRQGGEPGADVFVVTDTLRLAGAVSVATLLRAAPDARLETMLRRLPSLPALMPWSAAAASAAWNEAGSLPVVEHDGRFLGSLHATALRSALAGRHGDTGPAAGSLAAVLAQGYWAAVSSLSGALVALLPAGSGRRA